MNALMLAIPVGLYVVGVAIAISAIACGTFSVGMLGANFILFGVAFQAIADLQRRIERRDRLRLPFEVPPRAMVFSSLLFSGTVAALVAAIFVRHPAFVIHGLYLALFGFLFRRLAILAARVARLQSVRTSNDRNS